MTGSGKVVGRGKGGGGGGGGRKGGGGKGTDLQCDPFLRFLHVFHVGQSSRQRQRVRTTCAAVTSAADAMIATSLHSSLPVAYDSDVWEEEEEEEEEEEDNENFSASLRR